MPRTNRYFTDKELPLPVCLYSLSECKKQPQAVCPLSIQLHSIQSPREWQARANTAWNCESIGVDLTKQQYNARKQGIIA